MALKHLIGTLIKPFGKAIGHSESKVFYASGPPLRISSASRKFFKEIMEDDPHTQMFHSHVTIILCVCVCVLLDMLVFFSHQH